MREAKRAKKTATRNKTIRMTLSALHSMCSIYLLHFFSSFFSFVFDEENSITTDRMWQRATTIGVVDRGLNLDRAIVCAACEISDSVLSTTSTTQEKTTERVEYVDCVKNCLSIKIPHVFRNLRTEIQNAIPFRCSRSAAAAAAADGRRWSRTLPLSSMLLLYISHGISQFRVFFSSCHSIRLCRRTSFK